MRSPSKGDTFFVVIDLGSKPEVCNFDLFVFDEYVGRFDISVKELSAGEVRAGRNDLGGEGENVFWVAIEEVFSNVFL